MIIIITGPTASGKSSLAIDIAQYYKDRKFTIINADAMQLYSKIDIISSQPNENEIEHKMYRYLEPHQRYSVAEFLKQLKIEAEGITTDIIIVGGSPLYIRSIIDGIDTIPAVSSQTVTQLTNRYQKEGLEAIYKELISSDKEIAKIISKNDKQRILRALAVKIDSGISIVEFWNKERKSVFNKTINLLYLKDRKEVYENCNKRFIDMIENGAIEEVASLLEEYKQNIVTLPIYKASGLRELHSYLTNQYTLSQAIEKAQQETRRYAKRQYTWFNNKFKDFHIVQSKDEAILYLNSTKNIITK